MIKNGITIEIHRQANTKNCKYYALYGKTLTGTKRIGQVNFTIDQCFIVASNHPEYIKFSAYGRRTTYRSNFVYTYKMLPISNKSYNDSRVIQVFNQYGTEVLRVLGKLKNYVHEFVTDVEELPIDYKCTAARRRYLLKRIVEDGYFLFRDNQ